MKIREILEARYAIQKPNTRDVHLVARRFNQFVNSHIHDQELWDEGKPSIRQKGTISQGFTSLEFTFQNKSKEDAMAWVRNFVGAYSLPYTDLWSNVPRAIGHLLPGNNNHYTIVFLKYAEYDQHDPNANFVGEAQYAIRRSAEDAFREYEKHKSTSPRWRERTGTDRFDPAPVEIEAYTKPSDALRAGGPEVEKAFLSFNFLGEVHPDGANDFVKRYIEKNKIPYTNITSDHNYQANPIIFSIELEYDPNESK